MRNGSLNCNIITILSYCVREARLFAIMEAEICGRSNREHGCAAAASATACPQGLVAQRRNSTEDARPDGRA